MKRFLHVFPHGSCAAIGFAVFMPLLAVAQSMTLTVPYRGAGAKQTASTVVEFDATTIAPGATITVDTKVLAVKDSSCANTIACSSLDVTTALDPISVMRVSGTQRVQVTLNYLSSFGGTAAYCADIAFGSKTYDFTLSGFTFGASKGYRISSFMAPSTANCEIAYARVPNARPSFPVASPIAKIGRLPLNVVLVLDKSPSMGWTIPGSADIRWDGLKAAAQLFTNVWDVIGAPPAPATISSEGNTEDRLGLLFFGGTSVESPLDGASFFKSRGGAATPWGGPVGTALAPVPGFIGGTSIGAGTVNGRTRLDTVDVIAGDTAILLFTDGEQNTPPCVIHQGETLSPTTKPYPGIPGATYVDQCTVAAGLPGAPLTLNGSLLAKEVLPAGPIFTIGLGEGGTAASALLLDRIAQETAGQSRYPLTSATLTTSFIDTLVENLKGGTVSALERTAGTVPAASAASAPMVVAIDPSLTRAVFVLAWEGIGREVQLEIRRPDGTVVTAPLRENTANSRVAGVNLPADGPSGPWQARLIRLSGTPGPLNYQLTAYGVETRFSSRVTETPEVGTGRPIKIVAEVGWDDNGLADLAPGSIVATIERPNENLGNLLRASLVGDPAPAQTDASPLMVKYHQLAATQGFLSRVEPRPLAEKVTLTGVGNGRYEGTFDGANIGGHYRIRVDYDWTDPRTGAIRRQQFAERQVAVRPSAADSAVQVQREPRATTALIVITPRDRFGNYVGPGFENQFHVRVGGATTVPVSDPDLTGAYAIRLTGLAPGDDPRIRIDYGDQTLRDAPVSQLATGGGGRFAVWLALGSTLPSGSFSNGYKRDLAANIGFEYALSAATAVEATLGLHQFKGKNGAPDLDVTQFGVNGKWYLAAQGFKPFATLGIGGYSFDPGSTRFGVNAGLGAQLDIAPRWSAEARYTFHAVSGNSPNSRYSTLQLGLRYAF